MEFDLLEEADDEALQLAKKAFGDFIISVEEKLDQAIELGKAGDMKMLTILSELNGVQEDIESLAKHAREELPPHNYHAEVTKIIHEYIVGIIEKEYEATMAIPSEEKQSSTLRINQLMHIINFYHELYPELELREWYDKVQNLTQ